jgi:hypothetical protein
MDLTVKRKQCKSSVRRSQSGGLGVALKAKRKKTRLERRVLKRLRSGLPPSRWQQVELHFRTACRRGLKQSPEKVFFYFKGVLRGLFWRH